MKNIHLFLILILIFITNCSLNKAVQHHGVHNLEKKQEKLKINMSNKNDILKSTSIRLESDINFVNVNKKCMLELLNDLVIEIEDDNNAKNVSGGKGKNIKSNPNNKLNSTMSESYSKIQRLDENSDEKVNIDKKGGGIQELFFVIIFLLILIYI